MYNLLVVAYINSDLRLASCYCYGHSLISRYAKMIQKSIRFQDCYIKVNMFISMLSLLYCFFSNIDLMSAPQKFDDRFMLH